MNDHLTPGPEAKVKGKGRHPRSTAAKAAALNKRSGAPTDDGIDHPISIPLADDGGAGSEHPVGSEPERAEEGPPTNEDSLSIPLADDGGAGSEHPVGSEPERAEEGPPTNEDTLSIPLADDSGAGSEHPVGTEPKRAEVGVGATPKRWRSQEPATQRQAARLAVARYASQELIGVLLIGTLLIASGIFYYDFIGEGLKGTALPPSGWMLLQIALALVIAGGSFLQETMQWQQVLA